MSAVKKLPQSLAIKTLDAVFAGNANGIEKLPSSLQKPQT
jgi:hypothetical protein